MISGISFKMKANKQLYICTTSVLSKCSLPCHDLKLYYVTSLATAYNNEMYFILFYDPQTLDMRPENCERYVCNSAMKKLAEMRATVLNFHLHIS